jgi:AcrR family transcriptional regulator
VGTPVDLPAEPTEGGPDCIPEAFSEGLERLSQTVLAAARGESRWLERIRAGLTAALAFLDEHPQWAQLLVLEAPLEGAAVGECTRRVHVALGEVLEHARREVIVGAQLMPPAGLIAELLFGALLSLVRARLVSFDRDFARFNELKWSRPSPGQADQGKAS